MVILVVADVILVIVVNISDLCLQLMEVIYSCNC